MGLRSLLATQTKTVSVAKENIGPGSFLQIFNAAPMVPVTGLVRVFWQARRTDRVPVGASLPRIVVGWTVKSDANITTWQMVCDARAGAYQLNATSVGLQFGWQDGDLPNGEWEVMATLFDVGSSTGKERATFTAAAALDVSPGIGPSPAVSVAVPLGAVSFTWYDGAGSDVQFEGKDSAGTLIQFGRTGASVNNVVVPPVFTLEPEVETVDVSNWTTTAIPNGRIVFSYV